MGFITNSHDGAIIEGDFHRVDNQAYMDSHTLSGLADSRGLDMALKINDFMKGIKENVATLVRNGVSFADSGYDYGQTVNSPTVGNSPDQQQVVLS